MSTRSQGEQYESWVGEQLKVKGYKVLTTNFRSPYGEIDIIARLHSTLIFIEVKTRTSTFFGLPEESITPYKQERWKKSVWVYCQTKKLHGMQLQIDVIAILLNTQTRKASLRHFKNIEIWNLNGKSKVLH